MAISRYHLKNSRCVFICLEAFRLQAAQTTPSRRLQMTTQQTFHRKRLKLLNVISMWMKSVKGEDKATQLVNELRKLLALGGFRLTNWLSNSKEVLLAIPESERSKSVKNLDLEHLPIECALGVEWDVGSDSFGFHITVKDRPATRRGLLSMMSSIYDPLGFVAPYVL